MPRLEQSALPAPAAGVPGLVRGPWLVLLVVLSAGPALKAGDVQLVEAAQILCLCAAAPAFVYGGMRIPMGGLWRNYGGPYLMLLAACAVLSLASLRLTFFPPPGVSLFKLPGFLSLSRILELSLAVCFMLAIAGTLRRRPPLFRLATGVYVWAGAATAMASIAAWLLARAVGVDSLLVYGPDWRARGAFNEGGPYGLFLVSTVLVTLFRARVLRRRLSWLDRAALGTMLAALLLSRSKVGFIAAIVLCSAALLVTGGTPRKLALAGLLAILTAAFTVTAGGKLWGYLYAYVNLDEVLYFRPEDPSLVMGRIAASVIVPRMISAHPVLGIGVGNYSLMRNDPDYRQGLPAVDEWDLPGMGLAGAAAELGIPATVFLLVLLARPAVRARRRNAPAVVAAAASFQPVAVLLGVNLNFFYPWLVAAFVLAVEPEAGRAARSSPRQPQRRGDE